MADWVQHAIVLLMVGGCGAIVFWQIVRTLRRRGGTMGSCCSRGCGQEQKPAERVVFLPREMLLKRRR